jgi:hypothetical protein
MFTDPTTPFAEVAKLITVDSAMRMMEAPGNYDRKLWRTFANGILQLIEHNDQFVALFREIGEIELWESKDLLLTGYGDYWAEYINTLCMFCSRTVEDAMTRVAIGTPRLIILRQMKIRLKGTRSGPV